MAEKSNNENWAGHIEGWKASGESQRTYCEKSGLALSTFGRWWRKLSREAGVGECRPFVEIPAPVNEKHVRTAESP